MFSPASAIQLYFLRYCAHSLLSHLAPLQPGSHSQRPVTWWQLKLWTQSHLFSQPSPKYPLEQASDKTHKHPWPAYIRVQERANLIAFSAVPSQVQNAKKKASILHEKNDFMSKMLNYHSSVVNSW